MRENLDMEKNYWEQEAKTARKDIDEAVKETAKNIIKLLIGHTLEDDGWTWTISKEDIRFVADMYGVEI